jgi:hypothetical protein
MIEIGEWSLKGLAMRINVGMLAGLLMLSANLVRGQDVIPYDGLRAGEEAYQLAEEQRQQRLNDQLYLNDAMRARYGWAPSGGSVIWYGNATGYGWPLGLDYAYAYSSDRLIGRRGGLYMERYRSSPVSVFEPWPYIPGDIYGYSFPPPIRQPIGQRQIQTGLNRWESHPVYAEDVAPRAPESWREIDPSPAPPVESLDIERPAVKKPRRYYF